MHVRFRATTTAQQPTNTDNLGILVWNPAGYGYHGDIPPIPNSRLGIYITNALTPSTQALYELSWEPDGAPGNYYWSALAPPLKFTPDGKIWRIAPALIPWVLQTSPTPPAFSVEIFAIWIKGNP